VIRFSVAANDSSWDAWKGQSAPAATLSGTWHQISLAIADEDRDPEWLLYKVPWVNTANMPALTTFDFEFNTSTVPPAQDGALIGYGRNVAVLHNYSLPSDPLTDTDIFQKP